MGYVRKNFAKLIITYVHSIVAVGMQLFVRGDKNDHFRMKFGYFHLVTMNSKKESLSKLER